MSLEAPDVLRARPQKREWLPWQRGERITPPTPQVAVRRESIAAHVIEPAPIPPRERVAEKPSVDVLPNGPQGEATPAEAKSVTEYQQIIRDHKLHAVAGAMDGYRKSSIVNFLFKAYANIASATVMRPFHENLMHRQMRQTSGMVIESPEAIEKSQNKSNRQGNIIAIPLTHVPTPIPESNVAANALLQHNIFPVPFFLDHLIVTAGFNIPNVLDAFKNFNFKKWREMKFAKGALYTIMTAAEFILPFPIFNTFYIEEGVVKPNDDAWRKVMLDKMNAALKSKGKERRKAEKAIETYMITQKYASSEAYLQALNEAKKTTEQAVIRQGQRVETLEAKYPRYHTPKEETRKVGKWVNKRTSYQPKTFLGHIWKGAKIAGLLPLITYYNWDSFGQWLIQQVDYKPKTFVGKIGHGIKNFALKPTVIFAYEMTNFTKDLTRRAKYNTAKWLERKYDANTEPKTRFGRFIQRPVRTLLKNESIRKAADNIRGFAHKVVTSNFANFDSEKNLEAIEQLQMEKAAMYGKLLSRKLDTTNMLIDLVEQYAKDKAETPTA